MNKKITIFLFITSFIPVMVFKVVSRGGAGTLDQAKLAACLGFILAAVQFGLSRRFLKHTTYLERAFLGFLALGIAWIFLAPSDWALLFASYSTFLLYSTMFLMTLLPQLFGFEPFTFAIAKQWTPETVWKVPQFLTINLHITYFWSGVFLAAAVSCFFGHGQWPFTIVLPFVFILGMGLPFSRRYPLYYLNRRDAEEPIDPSLLPNSARQLVLNMPKNFNPSAASGLQGEIQFYLSGEGGGQLVLAIIEGRCSAYEGSSPAPILTITAPAEIWLKMARGEINRAQALMEGLYTVEGDIALLIKMGDLFKPPKKAA